MREYSLDEWMRGIGAAEAAGDKRAADFLRQKAQAALTGEGTLTERVGAGAMDVVQNIGRTFGAQDKEGLAEHNKIAAMADPGGWGRLAGQAGALAPTMLIPGAGTIGGAAAIGAGTGAVMDPEDPLKGALMGGVAGGGTAAALRALPLAGSAIRDQLAQRTPLFPGRKTELAQQAFREVIPQGERAGVLAQLQQHADPVSLPGFQQTSAAATRNPSLLEAERHLRSAGQSYGEPIKRRAGDQAAAVQRAWTDEFGGGASQAVRDVREGVTGMHKEDMALHIAPSNREMRGVLGAFDTELQTATGTHRAALQDIEAGFRDAVRQARASNSIEPLDNWRRVQIKERLNRLYREGAPDSAVLLRRSLENIRPAFTQEMDRLTGGGRSYSNLMRDYHNLSREVGQAEAGEGWLERLLQRPEMAAEGVHNPVPLLPQLRREFAGGQIPTTRYGTPTYNPQQENLLRQTREALEASTRATGAADIVPPNSATAANLQPMNRVLGRAAQAAKNAENISLGETGVGIGGIAMGSPSLTVAAIVKHFIADPARRNAMDDIARQLVQMFASPQAAAQALSAAQVPSALKQQILQRIGYLAQPAAIGAANAQ